jgi:hypothetical protein
MGTYLKLMGVVILLSGVVLGALTLQFTQDQRGFEQRLAEIDKKYEPIGKELDALVNKHLERLLLVNQEDSRKIQGGALIASGIILGSLFLGLGEVVGLLKKIARR